MKTHTKRLMIIIYAQALFFSVVAIILSILSIPIIFVTYVLSGICQSIQQFFGEFRSIIIDSSTLTLVKTIDGKLKELSTPTTNNQR